MGFFKREQRAITPDSIIAAVNQMRMRTGAPIVVVGGCGFDVAVGSVP